MSDERHNIQKENMKLSRENSKLIKENLKLKDKNISLVHKIEKRDATIEKLNAKLEIQKLKHTQKEMALKSEIADLKKRKDMTIADVLHSVGKLPNKKKTT